MSKVLQVFEDKAFTDKLIPILEELNLEYLYAENIDAANAKTKSGDVILSFFVMGALKKDLEKKIYEYQEKILNIPTIVVLGKKMN